MQSDTLAPGTLVAGRYRVVRELGRGGMGAVYVVEHVNTGGLSALKVMLDCTKLLAERASRFRREARASPKISSEHVVKVTDADTAPELDGAPFIVMELLEGQDVERLLAKVGRLEPSAVLDILTQVARGLDKAHAAGVIHRDLKPENVFIHEREDGSTIVKLLDFGISKVLRPDGDMASASVTGASDVMGTPLYMAPEQAAALHAEVGPATDVWAIGLMAVRMLTGSVYWTGQTIAHVFVQIMMDHRPPPSERWPELGPGFDAWFLKSCAVRASARYQSVGEQVSELALVLTGERPAVALPTAAPHARAVEAPSPQLVTQVMPRAEPSSGEPLPALGVSTAEPVMSSVEPPLKPARPVAVMAVLALVLLGGGFALALRAGAGAAPITGSTSASSLASGQAAAEIVPASAASFSSGTPASSAPSSPTPASSVATALEADAAAPLASAAAAGPVRPAVHVRHAAAPASAPAAAAPDKPPAKPGDLFDTQK